MWSPQPVQEGCWCKKRSVGVETKREDGATEGTGSIEMKEVPIPLATDKGGCLYVPVREVCAYEVLKLIESEHSAAWGEGAAPPVHDTFLLMYPLW